MKKIIIILMILVLTAMAGCSAADNEQEEDGKIVVAVSVVPEAGFVEAVAGDLVEIITVIPSGYSPANYQPTTLQMQALSDADIYFVMQMPTEDANILPKIYDFNEDIQLVNLREAVSQQYSLIHMDAHHHDDEDEHDEDEHDEDEHDEEDHDEEDHDEDREEGTVDPHIWLSPKRAIVIVQTIADNISELDSENAETYQANADQYIVELNELDGEIKEIIETMDNKAFMIYHGSYGYFADDYGLDMISLEIDGKAATAANMQSAIEHAAEQNVKAVFYQDEFDDNQAKTIAEEIDGSVEKAAPLALDYIGSLKSFANTLAGAGK